MRIALLKYSQKMAYLLGGFFFCVCARASVRVTVSEQIPIKDSAKRFRVAGSVKVVLTTEAGHDDPGQFPNSDVNQGIARFT